MHPRSMIAKSPRWPGRQGLGAGPRSQGSGPLCASWEPGEPQPGSQGSIHSAGGGRGTHGHLKARVEGVSPPACALRRQRVRVSGNLSRAVLLPSLPGNLPAGEPVAQLQRYSDFHISLGSRAGSTNRAMPRGTLGCWQRSRPDFCWK